MVQISTNLKHIKDFINDEQLLHFSNKIENTFNTIYDKSGAGNDFLGWTTLPSEMTKEFIQDIKNQAETLRKKSEIFVVVGIGGSYLGARAVIEALSHQFGALINKVGNTQVVYAGHNMSEEYMVELLELLDNKDYSMAVISKSGTTTEPAVAFRILKNHLENKYGKEEAKNRIVAITDKERGALKTLANNEGYKTYIVPDNVGGRYSVLTPVGLLPIAVAGIDIEQLVGGALAMENYCKENQNSDNVVAQYAVARQALYHDGKTNEILVSYEPRLQYIAEWWKQLYGESEGKDGKGIFPASDIFTTDLHS
ncbi:MAG: glucose-6-phosphate isomerase, partial [Bacteroidales bacterium]|nr:glucose-6-phosphate isomerase [Bacteroidales bacterium]